MNGDIDPKNYAEYLDQLSIELVKTFDSERPKTP